jgi:hypothetical protein
MVNKAKKTKPHIVEEESSTTPPPPPVTPPSAEDLGDYDIKKLILNQDFLQTAGVRKVILTIPVRKPNNQEFVRVHPSPEFRANVALLELHDDREIFLVTPPMAQELPGEFYMATLFTAINRQGTVFLWPVRLPPPDRAPLAWHVSAGEAAQLGMSEWIRVRSNMSAKSYECEVAGKTLSDPVWPNLTFQKMIQTAFKDDHLINRPDHYVVLKLRGLV